MMRNLKLLAEHNKGTRTLKQSILVPEILAAIQAWCYYVNNGTLIGGLAYSYYSKPRTTQDIDLLFLHSGEIPHEVQGFKKIRPHCFEHKKTGVEVEVLDPNTIKMEPKLAKWINDASIVDTSLGHPVRIASPSGIVASKLGRWSFQDRSDVDHLLNDFDIDVSNAPLSKVNKLKFTKFRLFRR